MADDDEPPKLPESVRSKSARGPTNVLDVVLSKDGALPPASLGLRALALLLDCIPLFLVSLFVIVRIVWPAEHPDASAEYIAYSQEFMAWAQGIGGEDTQSSQPQPSLRLAEAISTALDVHLIIAWLYFAIGEAFFSGSSLGKRACRIRSISTVTLGPLPVFPGIVRGGVKALCITLLPIVFVPLTLIAGFTNRRGQLGHDLLSRSAVIDERSVEIKNS